MCGRFSALDPTDLLRRLFGLGLPPGPGGARFNIAPSQEVLVVRGGAGGLEAFYALWGLQPEGRKGLLVNARSETVFERGLFRRAAALRRCLVPADGFFEWARGEGKGKRPHHVHLASGEPMTMAALWMPARGPEPRGPEDRERCVILTAPATGEVAALHERMPVIVLEEGRHLWLEPQVGERPLLEHLMAPLPPGALVADPVSSRVNDPKHDDPGCLEPADAEAPEGPPQRGRQLGFTF